MHFGLSTHLFHGQSLGEHHLAAMASHGFGHVELFATRSHFDYHAETSARNLRGWLLNTGQTLHSVHAPIVESYRDGTWGRSFSNAVVDAAARQETLREAEAALRIAEVVPFGYLVVHLGMPDALVAGAGHNSRDAARRSVEELHAMAKRHGVTLALEVIPNSLSSVEALFQLIDEELDTPDIGVCLDYGHAFLMGDVADAIEAASGHLVTTHLHDNDGKKDLHLVPFEGRIDWSTVAMTTQKVGYEGVWMMELADSGDSAAVLRRAQAAAGRLEALTRFQD